jgi:hypothetical protein
LVSGAIPAASNADPFLSRDQNPFTLVYGQPLPTPARLPPPTKLKYSVSLDISNTLNVETNSNESLYVDFEAYNLTLGGIVALDRRWALKLDLPFIYRSGGIFDHAIDEWHKLFGLPRADRPNVVDDQFSIFYASPASTDIDLNNSTAGIADSQLGLGYGLYQDTKSAVSAWVAVDMPLGDRNELTGNDDLDYSLWLAGSTWLGELSLLDTNMGVVLPGDSVLASLDTEDLVAFGHVGAHFAVNPTIALKLQLAGHSGYYKNTSMEFLGSSLIIIFGGSINTGRCSAIDIGFGEDIDAGASPDASLLISWRSQLEC